VLFQMSQNDSSSLIDSPVASRLGPQRALFHSEEAGALEKFRPYGLPSDEWLAWVKERFASRPQPAPPAPPPPPPAPPAPEASAPLAAVPNGDGEASPPAREAAETGNGSNGADGANGAESKPRSEIDPEMA